MYIYIENGKIIPCYYLYTNPLPKLIEELEQVALDLEDGKYELTVTIKKIG
jgi:hypothetical protein